MSKELTEQLKNGTLKEGYYYIENKSQSIKFIEIDYYNVWGDTRYWSGCDDEDIEEVLAKVPTYEEWVKNGTWYTEKSHNELLKKIEELMQKIHILNEANMNLENTVESQADYFRQQISVLENQLSGKTEQLKAKED